MNHSFIYFSILSGRLVQEEHPLAETLANPFDFGLTPFGVIVVVLLIIGAAWLAMHTQAGRKDLHAAVHHDTDGHDDHAHATHEKEVRSTQVEEPSHDEMAAEPEPESEPAVEPDDLQKLEGIGPKVAQALNGAGIMTFAQLAAAEQDHLQQILNAAGYRYMDPASWPEQAKLAAAGDWTALEKLQDELKGGKKV